MKNINNIEIIRDSDYRKKCIITFPISKEIIFSRNSYDIIFVSFDDIGKNYADNYIRAIFIPKKLFENEEGSQISWDIHRVHPTIPTFYYDHFDVESFVNGMIFASISNGE